MSRLEPGRTPGSHAVPTREAAEGAFRGGKSTQVVFGTEGCQLLIDGEPLAELAPAPAPDWKKRLQPWATLAYVLFFVLFCVKAVTSSEWGRAHHERATLAPSPPPIASVHRSADGLLTFHYPADFEVWDGRGYVSLRQQETGARIAFVTYRKPGTDIWALETEFQEHEEKGWNSKRFVTSTERSNGSCHGHEAAIVVRELSSYGEPMRQWSCTFFHEGHAFRFSLFIPGTHLHDQPRLREILEATELR